jgi:hypothetical protein
MADGLIEPEPPRDVYRVTAKGKVYADYILSRPLPEPTEPKWIIPK